MYDSTESHNQERELVKHRLNYLNCIVQLRRMEEIVGKVVDEVGAEGIPYRLRHGKRVRVLNEDRQGRLHL
eukprot:scaffold126_cov142-Skeletonema_marinoi.AAC.8